MPYIFKMNYSSNNNGSMYRGSGSNPQINLYQISDNVSIATYVMLQTGYNNLVANTNAWQLTDEENNIIASGTWSFRATGLFRATLPAGTLPLTSDTKILSFNTIAEVATTNVASCSEINNLTKGVLSKIPSTLILNQPYYAVLVDYNNDYNGIAPTVKLDGAELTPQYNDTTKTFMWTVQVTTSDLHTIEYGASAETIPITNVDNSTGFTNKTLFPSSATVGTPYTVSMDLPTGYIASTTPHIKIEAGGITLLDSDMSLSGNTYSYTYTFLQAYSGATVTYTGACAVASIPITNVDNSTGFTNKTLFPSSATVGTPYTVSMDLPTGYIASTTPHIKIEAGGITLLDSDMSLSGNTYSYTYTFLQAYSGATVTYTGACVSSLEVSVTNVDNTEGFINKTFAPAVITKGVSYRVEMYLPDWYTATQAPYIRIYNTTGGIHSVIDQVNFIRDTSNSRHYYCNFGISTSQTSINSIEIVYNGVAVDSRRDIIVTGINDNLVNFNPAPTQITLKETVETKVILTALEGYTYAVITPYAVVYYEGDDYRYLGHEIALGVWEISITPPKFASSTAPTAVVEFYGEVAEETELADINPFVNTFKVDTNTLTNLMRVRFAVISDIGQVTGYIDTAQFILNLYKPFIDVETTETTSTIFLGYLETDENASLVKFTHSNVEIVTDIEEYYHNSLDYEATKITLYLPFHGMKEVDTSDVMGKTLTIHYRISNVDGKGVIYLLADGKLFDSVTCDVKYETPIQQFTDSKLEGIVQAIDDSNEYQDLIPKVYISRAIPYSTEYNTFNKTDELAVINDLGAGKIQADNLLINTLATHREVEEIKDILLDEIIIL